ncbi:glycoside hydrolase [Lactobacillus selangorensis]|uniref:Glycoside hydrolase n=1 Tax=Lactobacillus selangorensis TaxID=81857 RepID=A0A0R2FIU4_9LACO|nr:DUF5060 domain-containing protein [Lactobacillus selangorensis]KRN28578.1 glycoside hydrolase [Lactobacillus selangorensis]KRN33012.1 glycoside hydrolase [Lactobacillus selangorensis]
MKTCEQWKVYEFTLNGPTSGNPFTDVTLFATFFFNNHTTRVRGFYDGNGQYKVRFMPEEIGKWTVTTDSNVSELNHQTDEFECTPAEKGNHGPVRVAGQTHFAYADGTPYMPFGTTAYAWCFQSPETQQQTLQTLKENKFNKIRMLIFPKSYSYNTAQPKMYPYEGAPKKVSDTFDSTTWMLKPEDIGFDFSKFIPEYFQHLEKQIQALDNLGVEADLILFHPYDSWGFARMGKKFDQLYLQYVIARFASLKNVWWALSNEYDLMALVGQKPLEAWDFIGKTVQREDPSAHLVSIHNFYDPPQHKDTTKNWYDQTKPWITHLSIQTDNVFLVPKWLDEYDKPIVVDECRYEGNIEFGFGDNTAEGMMDNFYRIVLRGGYATHGETYIDKPNTKRPIWWAHGGKLYGESQKRINYFKQLLEDNGFNYVIPMATEGGHWELAVGESPNGQKAIVYFGENQPEFELLDFLDDDATYTAQLIDTWNMTIKDFPEEINNKDYFHLPRKNYQALLLTRK